MTNGSGVADLLSLARTLVKLPTDRALRFVAFANEEAPYFGTDDGGSMNYARRCRERGEQIVAMLSLETMGYFSGLEEVVARFVQQSSTTKTPE